MKVHELVARCAAAAESADSMAAVREVLEGWRSRIGEIERALDYVSGFGGNYRQVFYRSPNLVMLKVRFPVGRRTPPHDHGAWASILLLSGEEKNTVYRKENGRLSRSGEKLLQPGDILPMRADAVHVAESVGQTPAIGLHVYGGDIFEAPRSMWNPQTLEEHPLDWTLYESFAKMASEAKSAPQA